MMSGALSHQKILLLYEGSLNSQFAVPPQLDKRLTSMSRSAYVEIHHIVVTSRFMRTAGHMFHPKTSSELSLNVIVSLKFSTRKLAQPT